MRRLAAMLILLLAPFAAQANDKITFGLDWKAEAEYGGYYQALATGLYQKAGLDVTIRQGGPQVNHTQLLLAGRLDFNITGNSFLALNFVKENIPFRAVAAMFQKDPAVLIAHPGQGNDSFTALKGKPIMISGDTRVGWWNFLKAKFGYTDSQIRPYTFNLAPFLADPKAVQQGYLGSEPFSIQQATGQQPVVLLVADGGFKGYSSLIATSDKLIKDKPDLVQRFIDASILGWVSYLNGDPAPGNALILKENPEMTQALLDYGRTALKTNGILESGDAAKLGIGAMTDERWAAFYRTTVEWGLYPKDMDVTKAYTLQFVNRKVGLQP
ncbi:ABC transporter substrate-binding protein [Rhodopila sp.]|uniref:ABC transporter substrate-binding protein n=1 Tax=Rhodopila sp. TaxID=2480087 RepID=UPI002B6F159D|nr:ABC transporter substrate-binding protein [Rhodopila sp.]HVZ07381.1 ABC transporter substrate-binding protein [Rhodopila sp.]